MSAENECELVSDGKNASPVFCPRCSSKILAEGAGTWFAPASKVSLPPMDANQPVPPDVLDSTPQRCWCVENIYGFENVGFTKTLSDPAVGGPAEKKFLCCADCEAGPLGWHDLTTKRSYLDLQRVRHRLDNE